MSGWRKRSLILLVAAALLFTWATSPVLAREQRKSTEPSAEGIVLDLFILRPLGIAATVAGTVVFIVSLPFSAIGGNTGEVAQKLVVEPAKYTFTRPLGVEDY